MGLRLLHRFEAVDQFIRRLAEHDGARDFGIEAAGPVVLDQQREMLTGLEATRLQMTIYEARCLPERGRGAQEESLLAAEEPALILRERGDVVVAHAGLNLLQHPREHLVLHLRGLADEVPLLLALDRLEAIDEFGRIHELSLAGELAFDARDEFVRHGAVADPSDGAVAAPLEVFGNKLRLVFVGIGDAREGRREDHLPDAAVCFIAAVDLATPAARTHVDHGHQVRGRKDDGAWIAVAQRRVGEPSDIATEPVVVVLHHQRIDLALRHGFADRGPAPFELAGGNGIEKPFIQHLASLLKRSRSPEWSGAKPGTVLRCVSAGIEAATDLPGRAARPRSFPRFALAAPATACRHR